MQVYGIPYAASHPWGEKIFAQQLQQTTVIEKTVKTEITEDDVVRDVIQRLRGSVVAVTVNDTTVATGIVVTTDGVIAAMLPEDDMATSSVRVVFLDARAETGTVVARDAVTGVSFIRTPRSDLSPVAIARSRDIFAGQRLVALDADTVAQDFIRARAVHAQAHVWTPTDAVQWDTALLTDDSVQSQRRAVYVTRTGDVAALSRAQQSLPLPSDALALAVDRFVHEQTDTMQSPGFEYTMVPAPDGRVSHVALVTRVMRKDIPLRSGDMILAINSEEVGMFSTPTQWFLQTKTSEDVPMEILRDGTRMTVILRNI